MQCASKYTPTRDGSACPANTTLPRGPTDRQNTAAKLPKWDTLNAYEKKLFARQAEVFAAYVAYTDNEIGRVIQAVDDMGKLDNTLIIYIGGDNGTSAEGSTIGTPFDMAAIQGIDIPVEEQLKFYDVWGSAQTTPHMSVAWSGPLMRLSSGQNRSLLISEVPDRAWPSHGRPN